MEALRQLLKNKVLLIIIAAIVIIIVVIIALLNQNSEPESEIGEGTIRQPLTQYTNKQVNIPDDVSDEYDATINYNVFTVEQVNKIEQVREFINLINKQGLIFSADQGLNYNWVSEQGVENFEFIQYDANLQSLAFSLRIYPKLNQISSSLVAEREFEELFNSFAREYLKVDYTYSNFKTIEAGEAYMITANRVVDGLTVYNNTATEYTEYLLVSKSNELLGGQFSFIEVNDPKEANILNTYALSQVISRADYPKQIHQVSPENFDYSLYETVGGLPLEESDYGDGPSTAYTLETPNNCNAKEVKLGYLFQSSNQGTMSPTFRVLCSGVTSYKGQNFELDMIIFASAIDPKFVYVAPQ